MNKSYSLRYSIFGKANPHQVLNEWYESSIKLGEMKQTLYRSKKDLLDWTILYIRVLDLRMKLRVFFSEKPKNCKKDSLWSSLYKKFLSKKEKINKIDNELTKSVFNHEKKIKLLLNCKELKQYRRFFELAFFYDKKHQASTLNKIKRSAIQAEVEISNLFDALNLDKDQFWCLDENNEPIHYDNWLAAMNDPSKHNRYHIWCNWYSQYASRSNLYANLFYLLHFRTSQDATFQGYSNFIEKISKSLYEISIKEYKVILQYASMYKRLIIRFKNHLAGIVNREFMVSKFEPWDDYLITQITEKVYTKSHDVAKKIVLDSYRCLGTEFYNAAKWVFDHKKINWNMDKNNCLGETLTAYGSVDSETINFNFTGTIKSIAVLSHEIGHAVAGYFARKTQPTYKFQNKLTTEIPSMTCELLTMLYCFNIMKHRQEKFCALMHILETFQWLVSNYAANALFKENADSLFSRNQLSYKSLNKGNYLYRNWYEGLTKYEKEWYKKDKYVLLKYKFYEDYYSEYMNDDGIKYYIGSIVGLTFGWLCIMGDKGAIRAFYKFIKAGASKKPLQNLKILKVNLLKPEVYNYAKWALNNILKEFEKEPTLNKPGSLQYGKANQEFNDKYEKIK